MILFLAVFSDAAQVENSGHPGVPPVRGERGEVSDVSVDMRTSGTCRHNGGHTPVRGPMNGRSDGILDRRITSGGARAVTDSCPSVYPGCGASKPPSEGPREFMRIYIRDTQRLWIWALKELPGVS